MDINGYYLFWAGHLQKINRPFIEEYLKDYNKVIVGEIIPKISGNQMQDQIFQAPKYLIL